MANRITWQSRIRNKTQNPHHDNGGVTDVLFFSIPNIVVAVITTYHMSLAD